MHNKKVKFCVFAIVFLFASLGAFASQLSSGTYNQKVVVSSGGVNESSGSYKNSIAINIINGIISSASYINKLGFFHILMLADGQPCTSADQCEGNFCCSNLCSSSSCPSGAAGGGGAGVSAAAAGGSAPNATGIAQKVSDYSLIPTLIKEHIALGATAADSITLTNTGNTPLVFSLSASSAISDFLSLSDASFSLDAGKSKTVQANIIGKQLGSYFGEIAVSANGIQKSIGIVVEVVSEQVLFDVKIDIPTAYKEVEAGKEVKAQVTLLNVGPARKVDVTPTYIVKDKYGNVVDEFTETFAVENQVSYVKSFKIPENAKIGDYLAIVELRYQNSFAVSSELFRVIAKQVAFEKTFLSKAILVSIAIMLIGLIFLFLYLLIGRYARKE